MIGEGMQILADRYRVSQAEHHKCKAEWHMDQHDTYVAADGDSWLDVVPVWVVWASLGGFWAAVALLLWWFLA